VDWRAPINEGIDCAEVLMSLHFEKLVRGGLKGGIRFTITERPNGEWTARIGNQVFRCPDYWKQYGATACMRGFTKFELTRLGREDLIETFQFLE
jgi:hypothetical protein